MKKRHDSDVPATFAGAFVGAVLIGSLWLGAALAFHMAGGLSDHPMAFREAMRQWTTRLLLVVGSISGFVLGGIVGSVLSRRQR